MTILTSAIPSAGRPGLPAKMTSAIWPPRSARGPCSPSTHAMASAMFDLPDPLGPTIDADAGCELEPGLVGERLEAANRERSQEHGATDAKRRCHGSLARPTGISSLDPKPLLAGGRLLEDLDRLDTAPGGPRPAPRDQPIDRIGRAFEGRLDPAVGEVSNEPGHATRGRLAPARPSEPDALDVPGHDTRTRLPAAVAQLWHCGQ